MDGDMIIKAEDLTKKYGDKTVVNKLNLEIRRGEVFGLLGPNGAGKTTTILMLLGLTEPSGGRAVIDGFDCIRAPIDVKRTVGYMPDNVGFYEELSGRENLRFTGELNGMPRDEIKKRIDSLLERVGLADAGDQKTGTYSRGMKQRLGIADVLMKDPKVVIFDEPTLGIDPEGIRELIRMIRELATRDKRTVLVSSHQLYQVQQICDRVGIFVRGKMAGCGKIDELGEQLNKKGRFAMEFSALPEDDALINMIYSIEGVDTVGRERGRLVVLSDRDVRGELAKQAVEKGYRLELLRTRGGDLDDIYRRYFAKEGAV